MERRYVLLLLSCTFAFIIEVSGIFFPGQLDHKEHEACNTRSDTQGTCERSCRHTSNHRELTKCGIKDSNFLYCCDPLTRTSEGATDISPPFLKFQCGRNVRQTYIFDQYEFTPAVILRPEAAQASPQDTATQAPNARRPGIPAEDFYDFINDDTTIPDGYYAVLGGIDAEKNAWPWMALVGTKGNLDNDWFCGGVLINEQWVLSALHCFLFRTAQVVRLGEHDYGSNSEGQTEPRDFDVVETVVYPDYKHPQAYHDLALLKLASKVTIENYIRPVCLPWGSESDSVIEQRKATLTGWGDTEYGGFPSTILQEVNVTVFPAAQCDSNYKNLPHYANTWPQGIGEETLCAGDLNGDRDACQGDSGGPLVFPDARGVYVLAGIVSRGYGCGHKDYPGLYANMRHPPYLAWIKKVAFSSL